MRNVYCLLFVLVLAGCSSSEFGTSEVSGKVSVGGQPLTDTKLEAQIFFFPEPSASNKQLSGKRGWARIGPDGTFKVSTNGQFDGAVIGKHRVSLSSTQDVVPFDKKYLSVDTSGLTYEVKPGGNTNAVFDLEPAKK